MKKKVLDKIIMVMTIKMKKRRNKNQKRIKERMKKTGPLRKTRIQSKNNNSRNQKVRKKNKMDKITKMMALMWSNDRIYAYHSIFSTTLL